MENSKAGSNEAHSTTVTTNEENGSNNNFNPSATTSTVSLDGGAGESYAAAVVNQIESDNNNNNNNENRERRTPFTNLSQVEADLALARTLQEQERAFMMLRMSDNGGAYVSWEAGSYVPGNDYDFDDHSEYNTSDADDHYDDEEDAFDVHDHAEDGDDAEDRDDDDDDDDDDEEEEEEENPGVELDPANFPSDEAYARALQDAEDREMSSISLSQSGINETVLVAGEVEEAEDHSRNSEDTREEVDHNELSYEELLALGDLVGTASRGLSTDTISSLPSISYKTQSCQDGDSELCVICRLDYEEGDRLTVLSCEHSYHFDCINSWLQINKVCPVCSAEVSTSING